MTGRFPGREGFSLLEVMVAVAVLAVALVALLQAQGRSLRISSDIQLKSQAVLLARERMTQ
ncbi:MAG: prepilin-type N-terminal cleavage/methylation domain-containing protein, partial [Myxococcales bacterium]|nr:prepilin-type N-terminal cleavage/methylation domain-containing protein [Myxococcales bacterium]